MNTNTPFDFEVYLKTKGFIRTPLKAVEYVKPLPNGDSTYIRLTYETNPPQIEAIYRDAPNTPEGSRLIMPTTEGQANELLRLHKLVD